MLPERNQLWAKLFPNTSAAPPKNNYVAEINTAMNKLAAELFGGAYSKPTELPLFELMGRGEEFLEKKIRHENISAKQALDELEKISIVAAMLYPYCNLSMNELRKKVGEMDADAKNKVC